MRVICFSGNLGNQVFYCHYKDYLQRKYPKERIYYYVSPRCPKVRVHNIFKLDLPKELWLINILSFLVFEVLGAFFRRIPRSMIPKWYCLNIGHINDNAIFIAHYLQDKYFYENENSGWLKVKMPNQLNEGYLKYERLIESSNSVAIHIRRGDYIAPNSSYFDLTLSEYYDKAIGYALMKYPDATFFFFSDDLEYVKTRFSMPNSYYVDCNRGENSFLDIKLMSIAKVNIIANSTFSYWAAYINNENKMVIYPSKWFKSNKKRAAPDIMLKSWVKI